ncbi:hypothetical protein AVEN_236219-1 [Araneus ventricosus]|uniref:DUF4817 domain-containing protein n=1 Tax=Araneus ventricosus TaxID=182803 RepID=A0A4Y2CB12_ARAVE|nr:hypothetical protein AVEN_236219-1 [Araneus ventricosus]
MPTLQEKGLLVKLFYLNQQNSVAAVTEFRRMKQIRRGPMSPCALRKMIQKFETTVQFGILPVEDESKSRLLEWMWLPRSLKPAVSRRMDFLKDNIYRKRPASLPDLKDSIRHHVLDIPADSLRSAVENMAVRLEHIVEHERGHIEQF